mgnify:FL=1
MRNFAGLIVVAGLLLAGCASIPLSTALSLSSMSLSNLAQLDPSQVRVRLSVPVGFEIDVPASRLNLTLSSPAKSRTADMELSLLAVTQESRSGGLFRSDVAVSTYSLALSSAGVQQLRELQEFMLAGAPESFEFGVQAPFATVPPQAQGVTFWADLKLSANEPFRPLINGAKLRFEQLTMRSSRSCFVPTSTWQIQLAMCLAPLRSSA